MNKIEILKNHYFQDKELSCSSLDSVGIDKPPTVEDATDFLSRVGSFISSTGITAEMIVALAEEILNHDTRQAPYLPQESLINKATVDASFLINSLPMLTHTKLGLVLDSKGLPLSIVPVYTVGPYFFAAAEPKTGVNWFIKPTSPKVAKAVIAANVDLFAEVNELPSKVYTMIAPIPSPTDKALPDSDEINVAGFTKQTAQARKLRDRFLPGYLTGTRYSSSKGLMHTDTLGPEVLRIASEITRDDVSDAVGGMAVKTEDDNLTFEQVLEEYND